MSSTSTMYLCRVEMYPARDMCRASLRSKEPALLASTSGSSLTSLFPLIHIQISRSFFSPHEPRFPAQIAAAVRHRFLNLTL
eukprot:scaffold616_cov257-Pinguiococcus_pyrenoidosus.AAC.4